MSFTCAVPPTNTAGKDWPLRLRQYSGNGAVQGLVAGADTVIVWNGGVSDVMLCTRKILHDLCPGREEPMRQRFVRRSGMIDFVPRGTTFEQISWQGEASACVFVTLDPARAEQVLGYAAGLDPERGLRLGVTDFHIVDLVARLQAQVLAEEPWGILYFEALSLALLSYVYGRYGAGTSVAAFSAAAGAPGLETERLIAFIEEHLAEDIGLTELSELVRYSPDHFSRLFKQWFGLTPYQYILARRVERAKSLLRDRSHSIVEVALACGFRTQAHLNTIFKSRTGVTPGAYRRISLGSRDDSVQSAGLRRSQQDSPEPRTAL